MADVVIVGAGVSGLYTAYQLMRQWQHDYSLSKSRNKPPVIVIIEQQAQVGGRIKSLALLPTQPTPPFEADLCAMRYYQTLMPTITGLVAQLTAEGATTLQTSQIPAAQTPLVTPVFPAIETALNTAYPPANRAVNQAIDFGTAVALATGDYANAERYLLSIGYTFFNDDSSLAAFYDEPPLAGVDETRFVSGFDSLTDALLAQIKRMYRSAYNQMVANGHLNVTECGKEDFCDRFRVFLSAEVEDVSEIWPATCSNNQCNGTSVEQESTKGWFSWMWSSSSPPAAPSTSHADSLDQSSVSNGCGCPATAIYRVHFSNQGKCGCFYDCNQVVFTSTMQQMIDLHLGTYHHKFDDSNSKLTKTKPQGRPIKQFSLEEKTNQSALDDNFILSKSMAQMCDRRSLAYSTISFHAGTKIYLHFTDPWWDPAVFYKFCGDPLLNQMIYYSPNVILVYVLGSTEADTLLDMFAQDFPGQTKQQVQASTGNRWIASSLAPTLLGYIKSKLPGIIASAVSGPLPQPQPTPAQLASLDMLIVHYAEQTLATPKSFGGSVAQLASQYEFIRSGSNASRRNASAGLWWLSGDLLDVGGGWVDACLRVVNQNVPKMYSMIE
jgi:hypothetical protein